ncbi:MAG: hypothetical protein AAB577_02680 [Patescibacteria group bacterium]
MDINKYLINKYLIPGAIIVAGILVAGVYVFINYWPLGILSSQEAADKTIAFVNQNIEQGVVASLVAVAEKGMVYQISLKINETQYESYITKDGKFLFPTGIDFAAAAASVSQEQAPVETATASADFGKCLTEKGVKLYGAWWCSHCQNQKKTLGDAFQYVNYIECEQTPTSQGSLIDACKNAKIESFPTWIFADGTRETGELSLTRLAEKSGCPLQ